MRVSEIAQNRCSSRSRSIDVAAARISLLGLLIEVDGGSVQIVALCHKFVHGLAAFQQVLQVLMHDVLHILQLLLNAQQLVSLEGVLPVPKEDLHLIELQGMVFIKWLVEHTCGLERVSKLHDELVEAGISGPLVVLVVSEGCGCDAVQSDPTMALSNVIFEGDGGLVAKRDAACNRARVEVDKLLGDATLVKPQVVKLHFLTEELGVFSLPFVNVQGNKSHLACLIKCDQLLIIYNSYQD